MNKTIAALLSTLSLLSLSGCCELVLLPTVGGYITDDAGEPVEAQVEYDAGDGPESCETFGEVGQYFCYGGSDEMEITVNAEGYQEVTQTATVHYDRCGPETEEMDFELQPETTE